MLKLERAIKNDAQKLAEIQKASFDEESKHFNNNEIGGPLGYDFISWQEEMMQNCEYFKVLFNGEIIGGALIFIESNQVHIWSSKISKVLLNIISSVRMFKSRHVEYVFDKEN
ncbi:hypothetical protein ABHN03_17890 [Paenibacillus sp. NRS-1775]